MTRFMHWTHVLTSERHVRNWGCLYYAITSCILFQRHEAGTVFRPRHLHLLNQLVGVGWSDFTAWQCTRRTSARMLIRRKALLIDGFT